MNADAFRYLFEYHFSENRSLWDRYIMALPQEQFTQPIPYSIGSVRNQIVHLIDVDEAWFTWLRGAGEPEFMNPHDSNDRDMIRAYGDIVERRLRDYLANLRDEMLLQRPSPPTESEEDRDLLLWQVLMQVINHGTDHRAQMLRLLHDFGLKTEPQDFIFYVYDHP